MENLLKLVFSKEMITESFRGQIENARRFVKAQEDFQIDGIESRNALETSRGFRGITHRKDGICP